MDDLKAQVRRLNAVQLADLRTYISGLMKAGGAPAGGAVPANDGFLLAVFEESCRKFGLGFVTPSVKTRVRNCEPALKVFLGNACRPAAPAIAQRAILATGIDLLYEDLQVNGRVVNPRSLAYGLDRLPGLIDRSFPGYAMCGHLAKIVRAAA